MANRISWTLVACLGCAFPAFLSFVIGVAFNGFSQVLSGFEVSQSASAESTDAIYVGAVFGIAAIVLGVKFLRDRAESKRLSVASRAVGA